MKFTNAVWQPRHIKIEPTKEKLTDAAGLGTLVEIFDKSPFSEPFKKCLPARTHARSHGSYRLGLTQLASFLYGHDSIEDLKEFQNEPALEALMRGETVAPRTMGDFLRDFEENHVEALNKYLSKMSWAIRKHLSEVLPENQRPAEAIHASIDTTFHEQSGQKMEGLAFNYDGRWGLDSQVVYDELGFAYGFQLRPGDVGNNVGSSELIEQTFKAKQFKDEKYLSGDSAYCNQDCIRTSMRLGVKFTFTAHDKWTSWKSQVSRIDDWESWKWTEKELKAFEAKQQKPPQIEVGRFLWFPNWADEKIVLNVVVKRTWKTESQDQGLFDQDSAGGYWDYYGVVGNISLYTNTKQQIIERHNKRGNAENFIKEEKYGYDLKHFPCLKLGANRAFGLLAMIAHNILRWVALVEKPDKPHFSKKLRRRFVFIPAKVIQHARQVIMKVPVHFFKEVNRLREAWRLSLHSAPAWATG
jgi:Transposase DDE domain group 1